MALAPEEAILLKDGQEVAVAVSDVALDDIVIVKAGGKVPVDGAIISGEVQLNEAMMTGESVPKEKTTGEAVFSGTIVDEGYIKVQAKKSEKTPPLTKLSNWWKKPKVKSRKQKSFSIVLVSITHQGSSY